MLTALQGTVRDGAWALQVMKGELGVGDRGQESSQEISKGTGPYSRCGPAMQLTGASGSAARTAGGRAEP